MRTPRRSRIGSQPAHIHANGEGTTHAHLPVLQPQGLLTHLRKPRSRKKLPTFTATPPAHHGSFVNVLFLELPEGDCFVAGGKPATRSYIFGNIPHGRDLQPRQGMRRDVSQMWIRVTGQSEAELVVSLTEIDPADAMEAGLILPEPGSEQQ